MESWNFPQIPVWFLVTVAVVVLLYKYLTLNFGVFKKHGINGPTPYPVFGTMFQAFIDGLMKYDLDLKRKYGSVVGTFRGSEPMLMIYDTEILKHILVKDFNNFTNRFNTGFSRSPLNKMVTVLEDEHWKHVRNFLTPAFSSGKLRKMNSKLLRCADTLLANLQRKAETNEIFDIRALTGAYTMDVIASTAFGLQIDSHNDPNNQFVQMAKKVFDFDLISIRTLALGFFPSLIKPLAKLGMTVFPRDVTEFFSQVVDRAMKERKSIENDDELDFLHLMMNAEISSDDQDTDTNGTTKDSAEETWGKNRGLSHDEIIAQGIIFFLAGYETTATTLAFLAYQLALNPEIQNKLIQEIDDVMKNEKHVTYDLVQSMPYLEMCISEVLRLYPIASRTNRMTRNDTVINGVFIPKGMLIGVPIYGIQNDPEIWPRPEKFDPERFTPEAKQSRHQLTYLPFGFGPRNCIGMRLALMELKMSAVHILQRMNFLRCEKTQVPLKMNKVRLQPTYGIKLRVQKR